MLEKRSALAAFVLAGCAAVTAAAMWFIGTLEAQEIAAACSQRYVVFADLAQCRIPAVYGAASWIMVTVAIAAAWVGGVRLSRKASLGRVQREAGDKSAALARKQLERAGVGPRHALNDR